jgi:acetyltransferase-like isoleucine patch superfamily enzyme
MIRLNRLLRGSISRIYIIQNRLRLKLMDVKFGKRCSIIGNIGIFREGKGDILIGDNFTFSSGRFVNPISRNIKGSIHLNDNAHLKIGNNVGISSVCIWVHNSITVGDNVKIGADCLIIDSDCHSLDYSKRQNIKTDIEDKCDLPIVINDNVLIGARCIILKGVIIGARTVIGAGSVVTKSIPSDCIAAGNPCRIIKNINQNK